MPVIWIERIKTGMKKSRLNELVEKFDSGDIDYDKLVEVDVEVTMQRRVPIENKVFKEAQRLAKEKKTTVEKIINALLKKSILKAA